MSAPESQTDRCERGEHDYVENVIGEGRGCSNCGTQEPTSARTFFVPETGERMTEADLRKFYDDAFAAEAPGEVLTSADLDRAVAHALEIGSIVEEEPGRFCLACGADIIGNDPHATDCTENGENDVLTYAEEIAAERLGILNLDD